MTPSPFRRLRRLSDACVVAVFAGLVGLVVYGTLFNPLPPFDENRPRHPPPPPPRDRQTVQQYPKWFDLYLADRVGYRDVLLHWRDTALSQGFNEEDERKAWPGSDDWIYLNVADVHEFRDDRPTLAERYDAWADEFAARAEYLKGQGIEYVVVLAPEKSSVYPEHLPERVRQHPPPESVPALAERLRERGVRAVNPLPALLQAKGGEHPLYHPQDTHWTQAGARAAYTELAAELRKTHPDWEPLPDDRYRIGEGVGGNDLRRFVRRATGPIPAAPGYTAPRTVVADTDPPFAEQLPKECRSPIMPPTVFTCEEAGGPTVLVFRDSFGDQMLPFLSADFKRSAVVLSDTLEPEAIAAVKPAVVVHVTVGRKFYLCDVPPRRYR